ncbi:hypothetical protein LUX57_17130 [Actinomadura madurae]|uniref:hypothetical protein n=1 Tax=Actinomadura madurae TaxID=1993 RepID=UPI0020D2609F|nr:hypothetical protein [Actinomadura madurae]MCP9966610.1 hypothetical protein [Actinomadura madurae]
MTGQCQSSTPSPWKAAAGSSPEIALPAPLERLHDDPDDDAPAEGLRERLPQRLVRLGRIRHEQQFVPGASDQPGQHLCRGPDGHLVLGRPAPHRLHLHGRLLQAGGDAAKVRGGGLQGEILLPGRVDERVHLVFEARHAHADDAGGGALVDELRQDAEVLRTDPHGGFAGGLFEMVQDRHGRVVDLAHGPTVLFSPVARGRRRAGRPVHGRSG